MKALFIGPKTPEFDPGYNRAIVDAFRQNGYNASCLQFFFTSPPGLANRVQIDLAGLIGIQKFYNEYVHKFNASVLATCKEFRPDVVLVVHGSKVSAQTLQDISALKVLWCHDLVRRCGLSLEQLRAYDHIYVFDKSDLDWLSDRQLTARFLSVGFDPNVYYPYSQNKDIDVFFVGAYYPDRRETLEFLTDNLPNKALRFYGRHVRYREPKTWARYLHYLLKGQRIVFVNRSLSASEINRFYARSKISINMHHTQSTEGCNPRVFEIMASGSFQICDNLGYVRENFGRYLETYDNRSTLKELILTYLADEKIRESKAKAARKFVLENHTFKHRISQILLDCEMPHF